ncbi:M28 family metallopeptidase [Sphingoaurantiacus capsulatus]|uniref:M28 family metallopeptidase n=1 Tax=Sphingoaurantiacus capsulatus TaxID=1771310 RepID=A0ABV7X9S2_9SPHN
MKKWVAAVAVLAATGVQAENYKPSTETIRAHISFLADDSMRGREAATQEYDIAAAYVASRFIEYGLTPAGDAGSFLQKVPMTTFTPSKGSIALTPRGGAAVPLIFGDDYVPAGTPLPQVKLDAPLVFAGFGVSAPGYKHDDYKGLDVKGKIVVVLFGAPKWFQGEERAHYGNAVTKRQLAAARGAAGIITVYTPTREKVLPFARLKGSFDSAGMTWTDKAGKPWFPAPSAPPIATVGLAGAEKLFAGAPATVSQLMAAAESATAVPMPRFALPLRAAVALENKVGTGVSSNVAGVIPGSDPKLKDEVVVLSAHLDHEGVGPAVNGDTIYNGAMDNASGIATMLEVAKGFQQDGVKPKRTVMFLAVTAEEKGLVGADYFAQNPTVPKAGIVANVNLDMPILIHDFTDVVAYGGDRSTIGGAVKRAAEGLGLALAADPSPDQGIFTRSDHYRFVQQGVPSVFLKTGPGNGGAEADRVFRATRYHRPNDDLAQGINYAAAARFAAVNYAVARELADVAERPRWNKGDFFGTTFKGFGAE